MTPPDKKPALFERLGALLSDHAAQYIEAARSYDEDREVELRRSRSTAWRVAGVSLSLAAFVVAAFVVSLLVILPLKELVPVPVTIDSCTGVAQPSVVLSNAPKTWQEQVIRAQLFGHLKNRESYLIDTVSAQYRYLQATSTQQEAARIKQQWNINNPTSPYAQYGRRRVDVELVSTRFQENNVAVLDFYTIEDAKERTSKRSRHVVTIKYIFTNTTPEGDAGNVNPLGFYVETYRKDPVAEAVQTPPVSKP